MRLNLYARTLLVLLCWNCLTTQADAMVFFSKQEAMKIAFGDAAEVEVISLFPTTEQVAKIEQTAKIKLESELYSFYVGKQQGKIIGYAAIESHNVRSQAETLLIVLTPAGQLRNIHMLAFHEPPEYQPPERWYALLSGRNIDELYPGQNIQGISGATLSTRAALEGARKVLSVFQIMLKDSAN